MRGSAWAAVVVVGALGSMATAGASCGTEFTTTTGGSGGGTGGSSSSGGTSTSSSGMSSTSSSGMSSTSSSSSGVIGSEDCFNGVDDNDDGLADCADPQCDPVAMCVAVFDAWAGPSAAAFTLAGTGVPACPPEWGQQGPSFKGGNIDAGDANCQCSCGPIQGACKGDASLQQYTLQGCSGAAGSTNVPQGQCAPLAAVGGLMGVKAVPPQPSGGSCEAATTLLGKPPINASNKAFFCDTTATLVQGGCDPGMVCAPKPSDPTFDVCVVTDGDHNCPPEYPNAPPEPYYNGFADTRDCADCTCGNPLNVSCAGEVDLYGDPAACGGAMALVLPINQCVPIPNAVGLGYGVYVPKTNGACPPSTPMPIGEVNGNPVTICCK